MQNRAEKKCPPENCDLCPRLADFRKQNREKFPGKFNAPVPAFGQENASFMVVGLAPGLRGANFTGRPFTGDYAGALLFTTLIKFGFCEGVYKARPDDGIRMKNCVITNAVKCLPPENKPTTEETKTCQAFFKSELDSNHNLKVLLALGKIAHDTVLRTYALKAAPYPFGHGRLHRLPSGIALFDSYHCSRYNTQTGRLTPEMFESVFEKIVAELAA